MYLAGVSQVDRNAASAQLMSEPRPRARSFGRLNNALDVADNQSAAGEPCRGRTRVDRHLARGCRLEGLPARPVAA